VGLTLRLRKIRKVAFFGALSQQEVTKMRPSYVRAFYNSTAETITEINNDSTPCRYVV
jgi:hypothetical protein